MSLFFLAFVFIELCSITLGQYSKTCNPMDYGAKGDGKTDDTEAIQKAMDDCYLKNAGGLVSLPSSKSFLSFALTIKSVSNIGLEIQSGSTLIISNDRKSWPGTKDFLQFTSSSNVEIFGGGEINGQGLIWWQNRNDFRPHTIQVDGGEHMLITNITIKDPPSWTISVGADYTEISHVTILAPPSTGIPSDQQSHNTDAVDIFGTPCWIHDCYFSTGDDNIAVKEANDTLVENCYFGTGHGASIGSLDGGWMKNITFNNIQFNGTTNGIRIKTDSGAKPGKLWDISYTNLDMNYVQNSIIINQFYNGGDEEKSYLLIDGVNIENVTSKNSENAGQFECQDSTPCHHIELNNVHVSASKNNGQFVCKKAYGDANDTQPKSCLTPE